TEAHLIDDTEHIMAAMGIGPADTQVAAIPVSHAYGFGNLMMPIFLQGTAVVPRDPFLPHQMQAHAGRFDPPGVQGVPLMFKHFTTNHLVERWPRGLQLLTSAGAPLDSETICRFHERFRLKIHSFYGTSEAGGISFDRSHEVDCEPSVGWPIPGVTITLKPDE